MANFSNERKVNMGWLALPLLSIVGVLPVLIFNRGALELWGIQFLLVQQFLWVALSVLLTALVYYKATPKRQPIRQKRPERHRG